MCENERDGRADGVCAALKDGIGRVAHTFGDKLVAFRFAPKTAARLQPFVDAALAG
jgi:hypothetical protein